MTTVKVLRNGGSLGLMLPPEVVERLSLHEDDELSLTQSGRGVELRKHTALTDRDREAIDHVLTTHARTLELLAKR